MRLTLRDNLTFTTVTVTYQGTIMSIQAELHQTSYNVYYMDEEGHRWV
jgi:hypothetical protein